MDLSAPPIVIRESRWKAGAIFSLLAFFAWLFAISAKARPDQAIGYVAGIVCGCVCLVFLAQFIRPATVTLDATGFRVDQLWSSRLVRWDEASNFRLGYSSRGVVRFIRYDYRPDRLSGIAPSRWARLPPYWTISPPKLLALMTEYKARWDTGTSPSREPSVAQPAQAAPSRREPTVT